MVSALPWTLRSTYLHNINITRNTLRAVILFFSFYKYTCENMLWIKSLHWNCLVIMFLISNSMYVFLLKHQILYQLLIWTYNRLWWTWNNLNFIGSSSTCFTVPVWHTPKCQGIYSHQCGQEEEESLQIAIMQCAWVKASCNRAPQCLVPVPLCHLLVLYLYFLVCLFEFYLQRERTSAE